MNKLVLHSPHPQDHRGYEDEADLACLGGWTLQGRVGGLTVGGTDLVSGWRGLPCNLGRPLVGGWATETGSV